MTAERMIRIATTEIRKVPALGNCDTMSFVSAIVQCSQLGLEPGSALGHAYLLPFGNKNEKSGKKNVQLIIGYRGMIDLARRSGQIASLSARVVREGDEFRFEFGLDEKLIHRPGENEDAPVTHVYAVARLKDGGTQFEVMTRKQIELVRSLSKAGNNGPWVTHWEEMAKKTAIRRLFKYL
ncbi:recombination protein RecT, partial [Escherichia coli]